MRSTRDNNNQQRQPKKYSTKNEDEDNLPTHNNTHIRNTHVKTFNKTNNYIRKNRRIDEDEYEEPTHNKTIIHTYTFDKK